jgi:hypothetical protein
MGNGRNHNFVIETRQKEDLLYSSSELIGIGGMLAFPIRLVSGYGAVKFLAFSDVTFRLRIEQAPASTGPWVETHRVDSALNTSATDQVICLAILPCGTYIRVFIDNTAVVPTGFFSFLTTGHPIADADAMLGGPPPIAANVNLQDCATATEASIKPNDGPISASPCDGGLLIAGRFGGLQKHIRTDAAGNLIVVSSGATQIQNIETVVPLAAGATFVGAARDCINFESFGISVFVDPDAGVAIDATVLVENSSDGGVTFRTVDSIPLAGAVDATVTLNRVYSVTRQHYRVSITNNDGVDAMDASELISFLKPI